MAQYAPETLDKIDPDKTVNTTWDILGAPVKVLRDDEEVQAIREARANAQAEEAQMVKTAQMAAIGKTAAEADKALAETASKNRGRFE
jgi:hypothetical protein